TSRAIRKYVTLQRTFRRTNRTGSGGLHKTPFTAPRQTSKSSRPIQAHGILVLFSMIPSSKTGGSAMASVAKSGVTRPLGERERRQLPHELDISVAQYFTRTSAK